MHTGQSASATEELNGELMRFVRLMKSASHGEAGGDRAALPLLWPLIHEGPMRLRDLAAAKGCDASTVSRQVAPLVRAGLVRRDPDPVDRRACMLAITDRGREVCEQLIDARRETIAAALRHWDPARLLEFTDLFREFNRAVEAHRDAGPARDAVPMARDAVPATRKQTPPAEADHITTLVAAG